MFKWFDADIGMLKSKVIEKSDLEKHFKMYADTIEQERGDAQTTASRVDALCGDTKSGSTT